MHRGDYAWHQAGLDYMIFGTGWVLSSGLEAKRISPQAIGRYLDGEEEREGTYR